MKQLTVINPEKVSTEEVETYVTRQAVRSIVIDENNMIALLHVQSEDYYKLPGGGIENAENKIATLERECEEEIGTKIEILAELGTIVEYRKIFKLRQTSYCYIAKVKGVKGEPHFTKDEEAKGFQAVWIPYNKTFELMQQNSPTSFEGSEYIVPRDLAFLKAAKKYFTNLL